MTQVKDFRISNSYRYPTPEEVDYIVREAQRLRNECIVNLIRKGWSRLSAWQRRQSTRRSISNLDNRLLRDVGLAPQQRKRTL